jgi:hypothetical protein
MQGPSNIRGNSNSRGSKIQGSSTRIGKMQGSKIQIRTGQRSIPIKSRKQITAGAEDGQGGGKRLNENRVIKMIFVIAC